MTEQRQSVAQQQSPQPAPVGLLQRACACGQHNPGGGECESCKQRRLQRAEREQPDSPEAPSAAVPAAPAQFAHDFTAVPVRAAAPSANLGLAWPAFAEQPHSAIAINRPGDSYEREAERIATRVVQMRSDELAEPEESAPHAIQREAESPAEPESLSADQAAQVTRPGSGSPLPDEVRAFMEPRFDADFSAVRVHTDSAAAALSAAVNAHAFTYGSHIWLGAGESVHDRILMAHELTHVLQQTPGRARPARVEAAAPQIQRRRQYFMLPRLPGYGSPGERAHRLVLPILGRANSDLYTEVNLPGSNVSGGVGLTLQGRADLYKATPSVPIGVRLVEGTGEHEPRWLASHRDLMLGGQRRTGIHVGQAAPAGSTGRVATCRGTGIAEPGVCRMGDAAPQTVQLGDLKPEYEAEQWLGRGQVRNYASGLVGVAAEVNRYAAAHPDRVAPRDARWNLTSAAAMDGGAISIPGEYANPSGSRRVDAVLYVDDVETRIREQCVLRIRFAGAGIWTYDFIPAGSVVGGGAATGAATRARTVRTNLRTQVVAPLGNAPRGARKRKAAVLAPRHTHRRVQRRATDSFQFAAWQRTAFDPWRTDAERLTGGRGRRALTSPSADAQAIMLEEAREQIRARNGMAMGPAPSSTAATPGRDLETIQHWIDHGTVYGRMRQTFGRAFVRIVDFYERANARFQRAVRGMRERMRGGGGGLTGTVIRAVIRLIAGLGRLLLEQVADRLVGAIQRGAERFLQNRFGEQFESVQQEIAAVEAEVQRLEELIAGGLMEQVERAVAPFERQIESIRETIATLSEISTWVNRIKWAWRVASCVAPPALGCLIGLIGTTLLEAAAAAIAASCWFQRTVLFPVVSRLEVVRRLPGQIATFILDRVRPLLPESVREIVGEVDESPGAFRADQVDCEDTVQVGIEHTELMNLYEEFGEAKVDALLSAMEHRGASDNTPATGDVVRQMRAVLAAYSAEQIAEIVRQAPPLHPGSRDTDAVFTDLSNGLSSGSWSGEAASGGDPAGDEAAGDSSTEGGSVAEGSGGGGGAEAAAAAAELRAEGQRVAEQMLRVYRQIPAGNTRVYFSRGELVAGQTRRILLIERHANGAPIGGYVDVTLRQRLVDGRWVGRFNQGARIFNLDGSHIGTTTRPVNKTITLLARDGARRRGGRP